MASPTIKLAGKLLGVLLLGGVGGVVLSEIVLPALAGLPQFQGVPFFERIKGGTTVITRREEVLIEESEAIEKAVEKARGFFTPDGLALTTDGVVGAVNDRGALFSKRTEARNLAVPSFLSDEKIRVGKVIFSLIVDAEGSPTIAIGVITEKQDGGFSTTLLAQNPPPGSAVFTTKAELVGMVARETGKLRIVPIKEIQAL
ncbi:hypothetical protein HYV98_01850, partial [Candidatus Azambacteria bacterium]|nr:hypothetical protein [Candidatus Azambacteria bacterium]